MRSWIPRRFLAIASTRAEVRCIAASSSASRTRIVGTDTSPGSRRSTESMGLYRAE
ncbi:hypothetical protein [Corallococcus sp. AB049A]|uniref:hypothetical protein n=1 Tax=Corallococcus sp. AB049A TaxID=2316721 RepID=UPI0013153EE5|nr:hypothetical protein [Corallococcus sp. AB049A]